MAEASGATSDLEKQGGSWPRPRCAGTTPGIRSFERLGSRIPHSDGAIDPSPATPAETNAGRIAYSELVGRVVNYRHNSTGRAARVLVFASVGADCERQFVRATQQNSRQAQRLARCETDPLRRFVIGRPGLEHLTRGS